METVKIGKKEFTNEVFIDAVSKGNTLPEICRLLGLNDTVVSHKDNVRKAIQSLELPTLHIKRYESNPEVSLNKIKSFTLSETNQNYYNTFLSTITESSQPNYKSSCGNFLELIKDQDFVTVTEQQIIDFANTKNSQAQINNTKAHLRSMIIYLVSNDINNAKAKVSKDMLIWLISK